MNIVILILGLLAAFGPLSIDMYLPALSAIATDFNVPLSLVQLSLASYFVGIATGQMIYGPLTDKYGRKPPLYVGLVLYALASLACALTDSAEGLIVYRFIQALGSCAGMVIGRAVVRDLYRPHESAKVFSMMMLIMGVAPILAPLLGNVFNSMFGWRSIFWTLAIISFVTLIAIHYFLKETHVRDESYKISETFKTYWEVLQDRQFTGFTFSLSFIYAGMFAYITGSSFVFIEHFGLSANQYSLVFGINAFGLIFFSQVNGRLLKAHTPEKLIRTVLPLSLVAGFLILLEGIVDGPIWGMCISLFLFILTMGMIAPNASACALANQKKSAGSASALMGTIQFSISAICSSLVSHFHDGSIRPMTSVMFICALLAMFFYWILVMKSAPQEVRIEINP